MFLRTDLPAATALSARRTARVVMSSIAAFDFFDRWSFSGQFLYLFLAFPLSSPASYVARNATADALSHEDVGVEERKEGKQKEIHKALPYMEAPD